MDYEKKYKDALERARQFCEHPLQEDSSNIVEYIFPELKESEDEKIRKWLISQLKIKSDDTNFDLNIMIDKAISWLEKQGEQEPTDKVEPKFQNGQWIVWQNKCYKVNYNGCGYELIDQNGLSTSLEYGTVDKSASAFTIQDAKDGDVLDANGAPFIYKKHDKNYVYYYCGVNLGGEFTVAHGIDAWNSKYKVYPATKEQRDLLFQKMKEAGYEWDAEKKELKKISQRIVSAEVKEALYDKPAWSEEDEEIFIEKACEWIKEKWDDNYTMPIIIDSVIKDFKDYIKGE